MSRTVENNYVLKVNKLPGMCLWKEAENWFNTNLDSTNFSYTLDVWTGLDEFVLWKKIAWNALKQKLEGVG